MVNEKTDEGLKPAVGVPGLALAVLLVFYRGSHLTVKKILTKF